MELQPRLWNPNTLLVYTMESEPGLFIPWNQNPACTHIGVRTLLVHTMVM